MALKAEAIKIRKEAHDSHIDVCKQIDVTRAEIDIAKELYENINQESLLLDINKNSLEEELSKAVSLLDQDSNQAKPEIESTPVVEPANAKVEVKPAVKEMPVVEPAIRNAELVDSDIADILNADVSTELEKDESSKEVRELFKTLADDAVQELELRAAQETIDPVKHDLIKLAQNIIDDMVSGKGRSGKLADDDNKVVNLKSVQASVQSCLDNKGLEDTKLTILETKQFLKQIKDVCSAARSTFSWMSYGLLGGQPQGATDFKDNLNNYPELDNIFTGKVVELEQPILDGDSSHKDDKQEESALTI